MQPRNPDWDNPNMPDQDWDPQNPHMPRRRRDRDRDRGWDQPNPNMPDQGWGQPNPNMPDQGWGQPNPNMPDQGWGQPNPNMPGQGWGQPNPNMPDQGWGQPNPNMPDQGWGQPNPNMPGQGWDQPNPNMPGQGWGQPNPNMPGQGWGQPNPNMPGQGWRQPNPNRPDQGWDQGPPNMPDQDWGQSNLKIPNQDPNMQGQDASGQQAQYQRDVYAAPNDSPYSDAEWKSLLAAPLQIGKAMMYASPSGPIGLIQETKAMVDCLQELLAQGATGQLLRALGQSAQKIVDTARATNPQHIVNDLSGTSNDPNVCRTDALNSCQQVSVLLRNVSAQDAAEYKQFVFHCAQKVAEAAKEGGMLSMGGSRVSPAEQDLLKDIAGALGMQRA